MYSTGDDGAVTLGSLTLLCPSCYETHYTDLDLTETDVLAFLSDHPLPFITASMVADEFGVSGKTARTRLKDLTVAGDLERYEHPTRFWTSKREFEAQSLGR